MDFNTRESKYIGKDYVFTFGKYEGQKIIDVIKFNPQYILWCVDTIEWFDLDVYLMEEAEELYAEAAYEDDIYWMDDNCLWDSYWD